MTDMTSATPTSAPTGELKKGSVKLHGAIVQAAANAAPALGLTAGVAFLIPLAGISSPFAMLVGTAIAFCLAIVIGEFARKLPTAGSFYTYITQSIGPSAGFVAGILLFAAYLMMLPFQAAYLASFAGSYFDSLGIHIGWVIWVIGLLTINIGLTVLGVSRSLKVGLVALGFEILVMGVLTVVILVQGGAGGFSAEPFNPAHAPGGVHGAILAIVYGIFAFAGFESAATLGDEAENPTKTIPRAVIGTVVVLGAFFVLGTYAAIIGFGTDAAGIAAIGETAIPFNDLAHQYVGSAMSTLVTVAIISSLVGLNIVTINAGSRMVFALGRDRLLPTALARTNSRGAPAAATLAIGGVAMAMTLISGAIWGVEDVAAWAGFLLTLYFIGAYAILTVGLPPLYRRLYRDEWSFLKHAILPAITLVGLGLVAYGNVYPLPESPLRYFIWATIATGLLAVVAARVLVKRRPDAVDDAGRIFGGLAEEEPPPAQEPVGTDSL